MALVGLLLISYLIGAIPTGILFGKLYRVNIRNKGSGNMGATNVWRILGWKAGVPVLLIDLAKGILAAIVIARLPLGPIPLDPEVVAVLCGTAAVLGHVFPVYVGFRGGKGVATGAGMLVAVVTVPVAIAIGIFLLALIARGQVSVGSILGAISVPVSTVLLNRYSSLHYHPLVIGLTAALAVFIIITHRSNIIRILRGEESRFARWQIWKRH
ncbi:MAG: glycerol-3-phosphate 1-O-acyltransferase PlsY [Candidatus Bipolaricaulota bacterium]|nr:glycerol-3-phosphate 1-O-acyltransferase PlsY [Candidatus Bipolaricaulota bacterium]